MVAEGGRMLSHISFIPLGEGMWEVSHATWLNGEGVEWMTNDEAISAINELVECVGKGVGRFYERRLVG